MTEEDVSLKELDKKIKKRKLYPPFLRNRMRWALVIYKWSEGVSWSKYHLDILHTLGKKNLTDLPINEKDAKRFVVEGRRTSEEKLDVFREFIEKVLPDYLKDKNEEEYMLNTARCLGLFSNSAQIERLHSYIDDKKVSKDVETVYLAPLIDVDSYIPEFTDIPDISEKLPNNLFKTYDFCILRQISDSPFKFIQMFSVTFPEEITNHSSFVSFLLNKPIGDDQLININMFIEIVRSTVERMNSYKNIKDMQLEDYRKGLFIPISLSSAYALLTTRDEYPVMSHLETFSSGMTDSGSGYFLTSEESSYDYRIKNNVKSFPNHIEFSTLRTDTGFNKLNLFGKYFAVNSLTHIKQKALNMRFSLL